MMRVLAVLAIATSVSAGAGTRASALTGGILHNAKSHNEQIAMMRDVDMSTTAASSLLEGSDAKATAVAITGGQEVKEVRCAAIVVLWRREIFVSNVMELSSMAAKSFVCVFPRRLEESGVQKSACWGRESLVLPICEWNSSPSM